MQIDFLKLVAEIVSVASLLHTIMPPWEAFNDFPIVQKYYKLLIYIVGYVALNGRSTVYSSLSTASGSKPSQAAVNSGAVQP